MSVSNDEDSVALAKLLEKAGRRTDPPRETRDAVYLTTLLAWQQAVKPSPWRRHWPLALAASILGAVGLLWVGMRIPPEELIAATQSANGQPIRVGELLQIEAVPGLRLQLTSGEQLRIAPGTRARFLSATRLNLMSGSVYMQSTSTGASIRGLIIETQRGTVTHLGTRYAVNLRDGDLTVDVRDGLVAVTTRIERVEAGVGERIHVPLDSDQLVRLKMASYGPAWAWTEALAPPLAIDGRRLADVLQDIAFETGRSLAFADDGVRQACGQIVLKGPFLEMPASARLFAVLLTTGLEAVESGERILIQRQLAE